jgi:hypothetical protein
MYEITAEEYFTTYVTNSFELKELLTLNTEPQDLGDKSDNILSLNYNPVGIDMLWMSAEKRYQLFIYYLDGSGEYIPLDIYYTYAEIIDACMKVDSPKQ